MTDDEISKAARDAFTHGTGFMRDGKHVPTEDVYMTVEDVVTDDLVKRLREEIAVFGCPTKRRNPDGPEAADYIEKLEAALRYIAANTCCDSCQEAAKAARAALGEKKDGTAQ